MHPAIKILVGLVLIVIGLGLFVDSVIPLSGGRGTTIWGYTIDWLANFAVVLTGLIPVFLILVGLFIVWLESDELKSKKELTKEMKKEEEKKAEPKKEEPKKK